MAKKNKMHMPNMKDVRRVKAIAKKDAKIVQREAKKHLSQAKTSFKHAERKVQSYMKKHPERAALIAAGVGAAIGAALAAAVAAKRRK